MLYIYLNLRQMLSCCQPDKPSSSKSPRQSHIQQSHMKYSFKKRSYILINKQQTSASTPPALRSPQISQHGAIAPIHQHPSSEEFLQVQYQHLQVEKKEMEDFLGLEVSRLSADVSYYEKEVVQREKQIEQVGRLLDVVLARREARLSKLHLPCHKQKQITPRDNLKPCN